MTVTPGKGRHVHELAAVFIASYGPMGSTLLGGLLERYGLLNLPIRKYGLTQYLIGEMPVTSNFMQDRIIKILDALTAPSKLGGTSVRDRDGKHNKSQRARHLSEQEKMAYWEPHPGENLAELYMRSRKLAAQSISYKEVVPGCNRHIEYPTDFHLYPGELILQGIEATFAHYSIVKMRRGLDGWVNAYISQLFHRPSFFPAVLNYRPAKMVKAYDNYNFAMDNLPGTDFWFDDLFSLDLSSKLSSIASSTLPRNETLTNPFVPNWEEDSEVDLYGQLVAATVAIQPADDSFEYIPRSVQEAHASLRLGRSSRFFHSMLIKVSVVLWGIIYRLRSPL